MNPVVETARSYIGSPWRHQGRTRYGLDCAGLVVLVARDLGYPVQDKKGYQRTAQSAALVSAFKEQMDSVKIADIKEGDVLLFRDSAYPCHVGILSSRHGAKTIIHATAKLRTTVEEVYDRHWQERTVYAFRFKEMEQ